LCFIDFPKLELAVAREIYKAQKSGRYNAKCDKNPPMQEKVVVGKVRDAHGLKGELFIVVFAKVADWMEKLVTFDLVRKEMVDGKLEEVRHAFTVKRVKPHKNGLILNPNEMEDRTAAEKFAGATFEIPAELLISEEGETIYLKEIEGFTVFDGENEVGPITGFTSNGRQDILEVESEYGEALIPLVPEMLSKLDFKNKKVFMNLPQGLIPTEPQPGGQ
jgi:16S rRNA processing protein RimM